MAEKQELQRHEPLEQQIKQPRRLFLWCLPRSGSTALAKCLSFVDTDTELWFEAFLLSRDIRMAVKHELGVDLPPRYSGSEKLYADAVTDKVTFHGFPISAIKNHRLLSYEGIRHQLETSRKSTVIVKDLCMAYEGIKGYLPAGYRYVFLIRNPYHMFVSFRKMLHDFVGEAVAEMDFQDIYAPFYPELNFYGELNELWKYVQSSGIEPDPLIIDTEDLLSNPAPFIKKICELMGAEYSDRLLTWDSSLDVIQEKWTNAWMEMILSDRVAKSLTFKRAFTSSCFHPVTAPRPIPDRSEIPQDILKIIDKTLHYYDEMHRCRYIPK